MSEAGSDKHMMRPQWKWEWNLNTIVILAGFAGGIAAWGGTWARLSDGVEANETGIEQLVGRVNALEGQTQTIYNHEYRLSNVEKQATDASSAMRAVETTLNGLATDMRVTREILQRIEASQSNRSTPSSR